ncbi:uncharacterized protein [Primulina huaijiensis]|uniref:uncharacterized protein isoform X1 n=2 Tax=Primulina huaijiensis TaxID=1492673 RepID=UPI003CC75FFF
MRGPPFPKKPKIEIVKLEDEEEEYGDGTTEERSWKDLEAALEVLVELRTKEVEQLRERVAYYKFQLDEALTRLMDTQTELSRHRGQETPMASETLRNCIRKVNSESSANPANASGDCTQNQFQYKPQLFGVDLIKLSRDDHGIEGISASVVRKHRDSSREKYHSKPQLVIPSVNPSTSHSMTMKESGNEVSGNSGAFLPASIATQINSNGWQNGGKARKTSSEQENMESQPKGTKKKHEKKEDKDLVPLIGSMASSQRFHCEAVLISSQHKRRLRSLELCPTSDNLFVTSALDGVVNLWQIQGKGAGVDLLSISECQSNKQRRWPEDIAWHPQANRLFSVYTADGGDSQISILELNEGDDRTRVSFLEDKPHVKGIINSINFMPWDKTCFVTGGSDHDVVLWTEHDKEGSWKPNSLHRSIHTSAVMGVAGLQDKNVVMSAGADKRIIGFDTTSGTVVYKYQTESKCMSVLTNPCDFNLFMVQTGTPGRQLKLIDFRAKAQEIHSLGWNQESGESQSALISQAWSPDGVCISSGSGDPLIHIFDIRHNAQKPLESLRAHHKRVLKAVWHNTLPLLISISSDLNIGLHTLIK